MPIIEMTKEEINLNQFFHSLQRESDRGVVLITATLLNYCLTEILEEYLLLNSKLKEAMFNSSTGSLSNFSNKIKMAYALKLIGVQEYKNLENIRKIRNIFAHRINDASFDNLEIIKMCKKIKFPQLPGYDMNDYRKLFYKVAFDLAGYLKGIRSCLEK